MNDLESNHKKGTKQTYDTTLSNFDNVWHEPTDVTSLEANRSEVCVGNLNQLILHLTTSDTYGTNRSLCILLIYLIDSKFSKTFITTYKSFTSSWVFLEKLKEVYDTPAAMPKEKRLPIQIRVGIVVKHWIETQIDDFDDELIASSVFVLSAVVD